MQSGFTKGLLIGSVIGASVSMIMGPGMMMQGRSRKRIMRGGRSLLRKSGQLIGDVVDLFR